MDMDKRYSHHGLIGQSYSRASLMIELTVVSIKDLIREEPYEVKVSRTVLKTSRLGDEVA
jgi:hypothetical protein